MAKSITYSTEADVKNQVKNLLKRHNWFWWMTPANGYGSSGISDFSCLRKGVFMALETKYGTRKPTAMQVGYLNSVRAEDGFAFVVSDRNIHIFAGWLRAFDASIESAMRGEKPTVEDGAYLLDAIKELTTPL